MDYETIRDPELLKKKKDRLQDEARLLQQRAIENNENLDEKIAKVKEKLRLLVELENEIMARLPSSMYISEAGCATLCLETLATTDPKRYALFVAKVLDHIPDQINQVLRGILKDKYSPFEGIGLMVNNFRKAHADTTKPSTTEAQVAELLAEVFDYASGGSVNTSITHIRTGLQDCVIGCEEKER